MNIEEVNKALSGANTEDIILWGIEHANGRAMISTNFRPHEAVLLHMVTRVHPDIPVLWVDHGYNTPQTYRHAESLIDLLNLNIKLYIPRRTAAHRDTLNGGIPSIDEEALHSAFTKEVKLEPFERGLRELNPTVWFTALRRGQTEHRSSLDLVTWHSPDLLKVCPLLDWEEHDMESYLQEHQLPSEPQYFDPTKALENRECGLHTKPNYTI